MRLNLPTKHEQLIENEKIASKMISITCIVAAIYILFNFQTKQTNFREKCGHFRYSEGKENENE